MANRMKEDEKNEKIIRGLQKSPANRRCINCNSLGPQYVCTNFWTFICTNCSGIHREFTHRVKSISMAKFTSQEVRALQEGGNERAKEIYFKEWDAQRHSVPDSSNIDKLRDFIKHVYVERRYTGDRRIDRPPSVKSDREESYENRRSGSRSPAYDENYERRYGERFGSKSPGYGSPDRFEVADERRRDDRTTNGSQNRIEDRRFPNGPPRPDGRSPNHQKTDVSSPPVVRPVRDILGGDVPPIQVGDPPKSNGIRTPDISTQVQSTVSSNNTGSDGNPAVMKTVSTGSLIDFDADPEPPVAGAPQQPVQQPPAPVPANGGGWASFDVAAQQKVPQAVSSAGTLESALAQLSAPGPATAANFSPVPVTGFEPFPQANNGGQWATMQQQQPSLFPSADVPTSNPPSSNPPFSTPVGTQYNQVLVSSLSPNLQGPVNALSGQSSQAVSKALQDTGVGVSSQPASLETKSSGRKELPADLFAALYQPVSVPVPGWQTGPQLGMVYGMQYPNPRHAFPGPGHLFPNPGHTYPNPATVPAYPQSSNSMNPFDLANEPKLPHAATFPSLASLQGALPNVNNPSALSRASSFGTSSPQWVPQQQPSYLSTATPGPYMMHPGATNMSQQVPNTAYPMMHQGIGGIRTDGAAIGLSGLDQHSAARNYNPGTPNSFAPVGGNPFG